MEITKVKIQNKTKISQSSLGILISLVQISNYRTNDSNLISTWIKNEFQVEIESYRIKEYLQPKVIENFEDENRQHEFKLKM